MSVHAFGSNVDEVQRKLSEILPLIDGGAGRLTALHEEIADDIPKYQMGVQDLTNRIDHIGVNTTSMEADLLQLKAQLGAGQTELISELEENEQKCDEALASLTEVQQRVEAVISESSTRLETATTALESQFNTLSQSADSIEDTIGTLRDKSEAAFTELSAGVDGFTSQLNTDDASTQQSLDSLKSAVSETHTAEVKKHFDGLNASTVETVSNVVNLVSNHEDGINEFFSAFDTDAENLVEEFKGKAREMFGELRDYTENECGQVLENALENLAKEIVEAFAAEIVASVATTQLGVSTTAALSPIIPELAIAKKVTGVINSIL